MYALPVLLPVSLEIRPLKPSYEVWGALKAPPVESPTKDLVHTGVKECSSGDSRFY